jgi:hypothetical protein
VDAREQHVVARMEDVVRAVPVMHVPVEHENAFRAVLERALSGDRHAVEETESHRGRSLGVVARRAHAAEGERCASRQQLLDHRARAARSMHRRPV